MKNKKKLLTVFAIIALALAILGIVKLATPKINEQKGEKTINIIFEDRTNGETVKMKEETYHTDCDNLYDLLSEHQDELQLKVTKTVDYVTVDGLLGFNTKDFNVGPWWMFESNNNECCQLNVYCPSIDQTIIKDGDVFTFFFMSY